MYLSKHSISVAAGNIAHALRDRDPVLLSLAVTWNRLLVVALLGAAMLLFRTSRNYCPEIQDARGDVELSDLDDGAPAIAPSAGPGLALPVVRRLVGERLDPLAGHHFVSEIFRPPIAPLARS